MKTFLIVLINLLLAFNQVMNAQVSTVQSNNSTAGIINPFTGVLKNTGDCFKGVNLAFHSLAAASTYLLIQTNIDYEVQNYFSKDNNFQTFAGPAAWTGYIAPVVLSVGIYFFGKYKNDNEIIAAGSAVIQASLVSVTYSSLLKAITGRPGPDPEKSPNMKEVSRKFRFGFLRGGIHYGWPSGHLTVNTAAVTSLMYFYKDKDKDWLKILGSLYLSYLVIGVTAHEKATMHWFSDVVAGTIMGFTIGATIGNNFRKAFNNESFESKEGIKLHPGISPDYQSISLQIPL